MGIDEDDLAARLDSDQRATIERVGADSAALTELVRVFPDPMDAFVMSPVSLSMRDLSQLYLESQPDDQRADFPRRLRQRSREERWMERRAIFQARRLSARQEAVIEAEAQVWAIMGIEFMSRRIRGLWERWEALSAYVQDALEACEMREAQFSTAMRDACKELDELERQLAEVLPGPNIAGRGAEFWANKIGDRTTIINRIAERAAVAAGGDRAGTVFHLIDNSVRGAEDGIEED
jgi:hypothetical protein